MDLSQIRIETERLRLVPVSARYAEDIFQEYRDPVIQFMNHGPPENLAVLVKRIEERQAGMKEGIRLSMAILSSETDEFMGSFTIEGLDQQSPEMGGWLKHSAHGHGYGREAAAGLKQWADENIQYNHILWPCAVANTPSRKLAESLGGKVDREYTKKTARGTVWPFVDYWIPRHARE
jgi:[ribosomal protein S5]-alanine N-acetyltransferase